MYCYRVTLSDNTVVEVCADSIEIAERDVEKSLDNGKFVVIAEEV